MSLITFESTYTSNSRFLVFCCLRASTQWIFGKYPPLILDYDCSQWKKYQYATDFYRAITNITSGLMLPLTTADLLAHAIVGSVLENLDMERLIREVGQAVARRIIGENQSVDDVARELHETLRLRNENTKKVVIESIYKDSEEAAHNVNVFMTAPSLPEARQSLKRVSYCFTSRIFLLIHHVDFVGAWDTVYRQISPVKATPLTPFIPNGFPIYSLSLTTAQNQTPAHLYPFTTLISAT